MIQETQEAIRRLDAMRQLFPQATSHASLRNTLSTELTALTGIRNDVARIIGGGTSAVTFGRIAGNPVQLDMAALSLIDRFFTAQLQAVPTPVSASVKAALSVPFQIQPSSKSTKPLAIAAFATDPIATSFDELFANIREGIRGNRDAMTRVGGDPMAGGGLDALIPGADA